MFDPIKNYQKTKKNIGYKNLSDMTAKDYSDMGYMCGLEVHQQLKTQKKLFCRCPAGRYQKAHDYDAEVIRHMRPTLSELGEYDGTALMEFRTRKNITYRIKYETACTYDIDDTPPFLMNEEALEIALGIAVLFKQNIVGELHITRKQYLDGSIPTGFQRTGIVGVAGEFPISNKTIRLIQMSIEEDACREVSDIGHNRIYMTDRLGMPLIETVTHPDMKTPWEAKEAAQYIRFMARSTGKVRTGHGASRQDVNVSVTGGQRVEIKGVGRIAMIPKLTHNEAFRQKGLLSVREEILKRVKKQKDWQLSFIKLDPKDIQNRHPKINGFLKTLNERNTGAVLVVNLPKFQGLLSHFLQPDRVFADEIGDRLKVIACLEKPNFLHSEMLHTDFPRQDWNAFVKDLQPAEDDAQLILSVPEADIKTTIETISERCQLAFEGIPNETRKPRVNGTTYFERVLPGPDRMYPDTDTAPISISEELLTKIQQNQPCPVHEEMILLKEWAVPEDAITYLLRKNLMPLMRRIVNDLAVPPRFVSVVLGHVLKHVEGQVVPVSGFDYEKIYELFAYVKKNKLDLVLIKKMLPVVYEHPNIDFDSVINLIAFELNTIDDVMKDISALSRKFEQIKTSKRDDACVRWIMGQLRNQSFGSFPLSQLRQKVEEVVHGH